MFDAKNVLDILKTLSLLHVELLDEDRDIKYMKRTVGDARIYFIVNEGVKRMVRFVVYDEGEFSALCPYTASLYEFNGREYGGGRYFEAELEKYGELILICSDKKIAAGKRPVLADEREETAIAEFDISCEAFGVKKSGLKYFSELGAPYFSGSARYEAAFTVSKKRGRRYFFDLGKVFNCAEIIINGEHAGNALWEPYKVDITDKLENGANNAEIIVSNTTGNALYSIDFPSGLIGPARILSYSLTNDK